MTMPPLARIAVAITAAALFVLGLAYWWQGNLFHEVVGTLFVVLLIMHNVTVLRWYTALAKGKWTNPAVVFDSSQCAHPDAHGHPRGDQRDGIAKPVHGHADQCRLRRP